MERVLRAVAWLALGALFLRTVLPPRAGSGALQVTSTTALPRALLQSLEPGARPMDVTVDSLPGVGTRAWMRAVAAAGTDVRWREVSTAPLPRLAAMTEPIAEPDGRTRITMLGGGARSLAVRDDAGALDSTRLSGEGVRVLEALAGGAVRAVVPRGAAALARPDSLLLRPVVVVGRAGWEGKFVVAALEEAGWRVEARLAVAPGADVRQGDLAPLDTARNAAIIALDASVSPMAASIARFVRSGGGMVALADAATVPALAALLPASPGSAVAAVPGALLSPEPRRGLGGVSLARLRPGALVLETDRARARMAAIRVELGRVVLSGYHESWRWRMEGDDAAPGAHRAWWSGLVASVAYAPLVARSVEAADAADPVPYASLVDALGVPAGGTDPVAATRASWPWSALLLALFTLALLGEWGSRRLRGAR